MNNDVGGRGDPWQGPTTDEGVAAPISSPPVGAPPVGAPPVGAPPVGPGPAAAPPPSPPGHPSPSGQIERTRIGAAWVALILAAVLLVALVIFIAQNARSVSIHYVGLDARVPLAVALLAAAVAGMLLVAVAGTARIIQLRRAVKGKGSRPQTAAPQNPR